MPVIPVSIRYNNPGAINTCAWIEAMPGYVGATETTPGNTTARFDTPEHGVAAWLELIRRYNAKGANTLADIVNTYGGGQDYSMYLLQVCSWSGLKADTVVGLDDDKTLLALAKAMFHYEAGVATPLTDKQILAGFKAGRELRGDGGDGGDPVEPEQEETEAEWTANLPLVIRLLLKVYRYVRDSTTNVRQT